MIVDSVICNPESVSLEHLLLSRYSSQISVESINAETAMFNIAQQRFASHGVPSLENQGPANPKPEPRSPTHRTLCSRHELLSLDGKSTSNANLCLSS